MHTPAGAQGLNTGIQDAYNLGWKLAQVLAGADDALLDTYEAERLPIAAGVLGLSTKKYEAIGTLDPSSIKRGKDEQQLTLTYHGGPLAPADSDRTSTLRVGDRAAEALHRLGWPATGAPLKRIVADTPSFRRVYGIADDTLLLVRPDGYIGHIATHDLLGTTRSAIRAMTPPTTTGAIA